MASTIPVRRLETRDGGFVDIPSGVEFTLPDVVRGTQEESNCTRVEMNCTVLAREDDHTIYSCGGLLVKTMQTTWSDREVMTVVESESLVPQTRKRTQRNAKK